MAKSWTFRITSEGLKELERDLKGLGTEGDRVFLKLKQGAPGFADGLKGAEAQLARTRSRLTEVAKESSVAGRALGAAGDEAARFAEGFAQRLGPVGTIMGSIGPAGLAAAAGVGALTLAFTKAIMATENAERAQRKLDAVLKATGNSAGLTSRQLGEFAQQMQSETLFGSAQIKEASARLATFRSISGDTFKRVIRDAADLSTVFGTDLVGAVVKLGNALEDPIKGYDDLVKAGVRLSSAQRDQIAQLVATGQKAKAQEVILGELEKRIGGAAAADQTGLTGAVNQLSDSWGDFLENLGRRAELSGAISLLDSLLGKIDTYNKAVSDTTDLYANLPSDTSLQNRIYAGTVGVTTNSYVNHLKGQLAEAEKKLAEKKALYGDDSTMGGIIDPTKSITAAEQSNVDSLKGQINALETLIRLRHIAEQSAQTSASAEAAYNEALENQSNILDTLLVQVGKEVDKRLEAAKAHEEERKAASDRLDAFISKLEAERGAIGLSGAALTNYNNTLELQTQIKSGLLVVNDKEIAQARDLIGAIAAESEEWENLLGFMDAMAKAQKADDDAAKERAKAVEDIAKEQQKIAERQAELLQKPFENALDGVQRSFTDFFDDIYNNGIDSFSSLADGVRQVFTHLAAELTTLLIFQPELLGGAAGRAPGSGNGVGVTGANGGGSLTGGFNLSSLLSPNSFSGGQWSTGYGTMLFGSPGSTLGAIGKGGAGVSSQIAPGTSTAGLFGSSGGGQFGSFLNSPLGGGAMAGLIAGASTYAAGGSAGESIGAGVGGAIGGIAGSYFGPIGSMVGSTIGSMLGKMVGGLFNKKEKWKKVKSVAGANLGFSDYGMLDVDGTFAKTKGKGVKADNSAGGKLGDAVSDAFNDFFLDLGATFDPNAAAQVQEVYQSKVKGKKKKGEKHYFYGSFADQYIGTSDTAEQFVPQFLSGSLAVAAEKGLVSGVSETILTIFKNVFKNNNNTGTQDADELTRMVDFGKFYDRVDEIRSPAQAAAEALKELEKNLRSAKSTADEFGLSVDHIDSVFRDNFADDVADDLLALKDPEKLALKELEKEHAARLAIAEKLGTSIAEVEELYALKRQAIVEQGLSSVGTSFKDFFDGLIYGDASAVAPEQQLATAKASYDAAVSAGDKTAFLPAADQYLSLMREFFASTPKYVAAFKDVLEKTKTFGNLSAEIPQFAEGGVAHGLVEVGENGRELIHLGSTSRVINGRQAADYVASLGTGGDTEIIHVNNPEVLALLKEMGGSGTINPATGKLEFKYGADTKEGGATGKGPDGKGGGKGGGKDKAPTKNPAVNPGNPHLGLSGPNYSGPQGAGTGVDASDPNNDNPTRSPKDGGTGGAGWDSAYGPAPSSLIDGWGSGYGTQVTNTASGVPVDIDSFMHDWADYQGIGYGDMPADTAWDSFWNGAAKLLGFAEKNPLTDPDYGKPGSSAPGSGAQWGWDPASLIGSILGGVAGMPFGGGLIAGLISELLGRPLEMNLGSSVLGGASGAGSLPADAAGSTPSTVDRMAQMSGPSAQATSGPPVQKGGVSDLFKEGGGAIYRQLQGLQREMSGLRGDLANTMKSMAAATMISNSYARYDRR